MNNTQRRSFPLNTSNVALFVSYNVCRCLRTTRFSNVRMLIKRRRNHDGRAGIAPSVSTSHPSSIFTFQILSAEIERLSAWSVPRREEVLVSKKFDKAVSIASMGEDDFFLSFFFFFFGLSRRDTVVNSPRVIARNKSCANSMEIPSSDMPAQPSFTKRRFSSLLRRISSLHRWCSALVLLRKILLRRKERRT